VAAHPVVLEERRGPVLVLTINRPESCNAVNMEVAQLIDEALDRAEEESTVLAVIISGSGDRAFCAGQDLKELESGKDPAIIPGHGFAGVTQRRFNKPLIAAVNGLAFGGGMEIALATDCVIAAQTALFALSEVKRGLMAGGGGPIRLARSIPRAQALEIVMTGEPVTAQRAYEMGFVNRVMPPDAVLPEAIALAECITANAPIGVAVSRQLVEDAQEMTLDEVWLRSDEYLSRVLESEDVKEGMLAFAEKRTPVWCGR